MRIMKSIVFVLVLLCTINSTTAQIECPSPINICNGYFYLDAESDFHLENYIVYISNEENGIDEPYSWVYNDVIPIDGNIGFQLEGNYPNGGQYAIYTWLDDPTILVCEGLYINSNCLDFLLPLDGDCEIEGGIGSGFTDETPCDSLGENVLPYIIKGKCLGDTSRLSISPNQLNVIPNPYLPFSIDRFEINNGYVISYDEQGVDVVWDQEGVDCIFLYTENKHGGTGMTAIAVEVEEIESMDILYQGVSEESIEICQGETVQFSSIPYNNITTIWTSESDDMQYGSNFHKTYDYPGEYQVVLGPSQDCKCAINDTITVTVFPGETPGIDCVGTVCVDSIATYYSEIECDNYIWSVSPEGVVIDGGGPLDFFVTVEWISGPSGEITLNTPGCITNPCRESITETIPIIDGNATIYGLDEVCFDERVQYHLLNYTGTDFEWSLTGPGQLLGWTNQNPIRVRWDENSTETSATLSVVFDNCNLNCSGSASLEIDLLRNINIEIDNRKFCEVADITVGNNLDYTVDYTIIHPDGSESNFDNTNTLNTTLTDIGKYTIRLTNPANPTCNIDDETTIQIFENPDAPLDILGPEIICKDLNVQYTIPDLGLYDIVHWEVTDGNTNPPKNYTERTLNISWQSDGPYIISAMIEDITTRCISESYIESFEGEYELNGPDTLCLAIEYLYNISPYFGGKIDWTVTPPDAADIIFTRDSVVSIIPIQNTTFSVNANYCAFEGSVISTVPLLDVDINYEEIVCMYEQAEVQINAPSGSSAIIRSFPQNITVSNSLNSSLFPGSYLVEVTSPHDCIYTEEIHIAAYDTFDIRISSLGPFVFCMPHDPIEIFATDLGPGFSYIWYHNGIPLAETSPTLQATDFGTYHFVVQDPNGCYSEVSDEIILQEANGVSGPNVTIDTTAITCQHISFTVEQPYESTQFNWSFDDGNFATGTTVEHEFTEAGYYIVGVSGNGGCGTFAGTVCGVEQTSDACESGAILITIPVVADFRYNTSCVDEPTKFVDRSTLLPTVLSVNYYWTFFDTVNGTSTSSDANPSYTFTEAGTYLVILEIEDPVTGCTSSKELSVEVVEGPTLIFDFELDNCIGYQVMFTANSSDPDVKYLWQFGETINGIEQTSRDQNPFYTYNTIGNQIVQLTGTNLNGCSTAISQEISISASTLSGDISSDTAYPKCPGEEATLTAPQGLSYLWSTEETTSQITIINPGIYEVTVTNSDGCEYTPFPHTVSDAQLGNALISVTEYGVSDEEPTTHYGSLSICEGRSFTMQSIPIPHTEYTWLGGASDGADARILDYEDHFENLSAGSYDYYIEIRDTLTNCEAVYGPFELNIVANPDNAILESDNDSPCVGDIITVTITNADPSMTYTWSNGHVGESYSGVANATLRVVVTNSLGCIAYSNVVGVRNYPRVDVWMTGCMEVCFPREICLNLGVNQTIDYSLVKDGIHYANINTPLSSIEITEPGDYQLAAENIYGCEAISEILSLSAAPDDHQLSGIVYIDYNENGIYEQTDELLEGVPVTLYNGNTAVSSTITDINGSYIFDPVLHANLSVSIDISNIELVLSGNQDSILVFTGCIEDKIVDFPLINSCPEIETDTIYNVCMGEGVLLEGVQYFANDIDTLRYTLTNGCDSLRIIAVAEYEAPEVSATVEATCEDSNTGSLYITVLSGNNLSYSVDADTEIFEDPFLHDLSQGEHTLYIIDESGCPYSLTFNIPVIDPPSIDIIPYSACLDDNNGYIEINIVTGSGLTFSMTPNGTFTEDLIIENIVQGNHTLYIRDENNCEHSQPFEIQTISIPEILIETIGSCSDDNEGNATIEIISGNDLLFSLDNEEFDNILEYNQLSSGDYMMYILDAEGCLHMEEFTIPIFPSTAFDVDINNACGDNALGSLSILNPTLGTEYSLDNGIFSNDTEYSNIDLGEHMIIAITAEGCIDTLNFNIENLTEAEIEFDIFNACENLDLGSIEIDSLYLGEYYSIDNMNYTTDLVYNDLDVGPHIIYYQYAEDCIFQFPFEIESIAEPLVELNPVSTCENESNGSISISTSNPNLQYSLDNINFQSETEYTQLAEGSYILYVLNTEDCIYEYNFAIEETELPKVNIDAQNSCFGEESGVISISDLNEGDLISFDGSEYTIETEFEAISPGIYTIEIVDTLGCSNISEVEILENPELLVNISVPENDCHPEPFSIEPNITSSYGHIDYLWSDGSTDNKYFANKSEQVTLTISDACGSVTYDWDLAFAPSADNNDIFIPNIFSPNGDGQNDCFVSTFSPQIELISYHQMIFDRWGNRMFMTENANDCWDGKFHGEPMVTGVYVSVTTIVVRGCSGDKAIKKIGDVTIIR